MQAFHHASVLLLGVSVPKLKFSAKMLPEVVFLLDISESMKEAAYKFLLKSLQTLIKHLPDDAPFNIITFGKTSGPEVMWPKSQLRSKKSAAAAVKYAGSLKATGGNSDIVGGLQAVADLQKFDGFDRQCVVLTDGHINLGTSDFESYLGMAKAKVMRIFCVGYGASALRLCARLSGVGRGVCAVSEAGDSEKHFKPALEELLNCVLQPPTVSTNVELKKSTVREDLLDKSSLDACFEDHRLNLFFTLPPGVRKVEGIIELFLGEGSASVDLVTSGCVFDMQHPMSGVVGKMCAHAFMEELMQGRPFNNDRVARRKAQGDVAAVESRWTTNIVSHEAGPYHSTRQPGLIKHRNERVGGSGAGLSSSSNNNNNNNDAGKKTGGRKPAPPIGTAIPSAVGGADSVAAVPPALLQRGGPQSLDPGTWPRPQANPSSEDSVNKAREMMKRWRTTKGAGNLSEKDHIYRFEADGYAIDIGMKFLAEKQKIPAEHLSRSSIKAIQKAVASSIPKFETFFSSNLDSSDSLAPVEELRNIMHDALESKRLTSGGGHSNDKISSSDVDILCSGSVPVLVSCCGKVGGRSGGMEDRHVCFPNFYSLMKVSTMEQDALFCGVYDGHAGPLCAEFCRLQLHINLISQHRTKPWPEAIRAAFHETDKQFREVASVRRLKDGTTASILLIEENVLYHANVGDGEGFLRLKSGELQNVTTAHKASDPAEVARMRDVEEQKKMKCVVDLGTGGLVVTDPLGNYIRVARSIGDPAYHPDIVTCDPTVGEIKLTPESELVVIASDGVWDVLKFEEVSQMLHDLNPAAQVKAAEILVDEAISRGSADNCTAIVVYLK
jgi:serine/threonine protein phosphatase PrpC